MQNSSQDINYQPGVKQFSYSNSNYKNKKSKLLLIVSISLAVLIVIIFLSFLSLTYFKKVSTKSHRIEGPFYSKKLNLWFLNGNLNGYAKDSIIISANSKIFEFKLTPITIYQIVKGVTIVNGSTSASLVLSPDTSLNELKKQENIGKSIQVYFDYDKSTKEKILKKIYLVPTETSSDYFDNLTFLQY